MIPLHEPDLSMCINETEIPNSDVTSLEERIFWETDHALNRNRWGGSGAIEITKKEPSAMRKGCCRD